LSKSGYVGEFGDTRFRIREKSPVPRYYALQAFGSVSAEDGSAVLSVRFRRRRWASITLWALRVLWALLLVGAIVSSTQQAAFYPFVFLVAVVGGALLWMWRERRSDRESLHKFIIDTFPGAEELP
jgi:peptidoglycan/LPS O-acetylase OafA/YrhL